VQEYLISFFETDLLQRMPPTEIDSIWFSDRNSNKLYFGHLFLMKVQHLKSLLTFTGFKVDKRIKTDLGKTSLFIGLLLYPVLTIISFFTFFSYSNNKIDKKIRKKIFWERLTLNLSPFTLFYKHIFWIIRKENELSDVVARLKKMKSK
jgi:hypothetical protein